MHNGVALGAGFEMTGHSDGYRSSNGGSKKIEKCPDCGGKLQSSRYPRLLRAESENSPISVHRLSFCCDTCRKRVTLSSVWFFDRNDHYDLHVARLRPCSLDGQANQAQHDNLQSLLGISKRTLARWWLWWRDAFIRTSLWKSEGVIILPPIPRQELPGGL